MLESTYTNNNGKFPVNEIKLPYNGIKSYDTDTEMSVELYSEGEKSTDINDIAFFILSNSKDDFTNVTDYRVENGTVFFKMPKIESDKYYPQIMDKSGKVYSSNNNEYIDVVYNQESRVIEVFPIIKKQVVDEVTPHIKQFMLDNVEYFKGEKGSGERGEKGEQGDRGNRGFQGNRGLKGDKGEQGDRGEKGEKGDRGFQGNRGLKGDKGEKGERGEKGEQGERGFQGNRGLKGEPFTYDDFTTEQIEEITSHLQDGLDGVDGEKGEKGEDGTVDFDALTPEQLLMLTPEFELEENGDLYYKLRSDS